MQHVRLKGWQRWLKDSPNDSSCMWTAGLEECIFGMFAAVCQLVLSCFSTNIHAMSARSSFSFFGLCRLLVIWISRHGGHSHCVQHPLEPDLISSHHSNEEACCRPLLPRSSGHVYPNTPRLLPFCGCFWLLLLLAHVCVCVYKRQRYTDICQRMNMASEVKRSRPRF